MFELQRPLDEPKLQSSNHKLCRVLIQRCHKMTPFSEISPQKPHTKSPLGGLATRKRPKEALTLQTGACGHPTGLTDT